MPPGEVSTAQAIVRGAAGVLATGLSPPLRDMAFAHGGREDNCSLGELKSGSPAVFRLFRFPGLV